MLLNLLINPLDSDFRFHCCILKRNHVMFRYHSCHFLYFYSKNIFIIKIHKARLGLSNSLTLYIIKFLGRRNVLCIIPYGILLRNLKNLV